MRVQSNCIKCQVALRYTRLCQCDLFGLCLPDISLFTGRSNNLNMGFCPFLPQQNIQFIDGQWSKFIKCV